MKQHITVEQLKELEVGVIIETFFKNNPNKNNLIKNYQNTKEKSDIWYDWVSREITIGKMIEILKSKGVNWFEVGYPEIKETREKKVFIKITKDLYFWGDNLCDALWEAVKYVLEESE